MKTSALIKSPGNGNKIFLVGKLQKNFLILKTGWHLLVIIYGD